ncbi:alpha/beta hydrolase [Phytohabitans sp. ZYX-F-186]|uniref:Alpha/beta hydrolase n=1 Tax=Phytohabitans maris TaxID=3071409 RepID=A0ABU0ZU64_9ACTN|nr:alpha/beta hydrolase [Phytohabitans sp. ZYX-F-186]MDQ7909487.1 alpha/beta hydrolase [Phytohabitans sp. ZYX-F-186]
MTPQITGFEYHRVPVAEGVALNAAVGGSGRPVVLLHGFPQTHLMWRHVAADLAADHTVIAPDLRGYGDSDKPADPDGGAYSKRTMAADIVALARALGHERFALAGHDRGALVAIRAGLDHPDTVTHLASLDVLPTLDMWDVMRGTTAAVGFHLYLMAQPPGLPERLIGASPDAFFGHFLDIWSRGGQGPARGAERREGAEPAAGTERERQQARSRDPEAIPAPVRAAYLAASRAAVPSIVADYRASAGIDVEHDRADRAAGNTLRMPVTVLQQDWGAALGFDAAAIWRAWAPDLRHETVSCGHFMAEEAPAEVVKALRALLAR